MRDRWTFGVGVFFLVFAAFVLLAWIPRDVESGIVEVFRRSRTIGDAMAPAVAATGVGLSSLVLVLQAFFQPRDQGVGAPGHLSPENVLYLSVLLGLLALALVTIFWIGPLTAQAVASLWEPGVAYRTLRGSAPWKYFGYLTGGTLLVFGLVSFVEQSLRWKKLAIAFLVTLLIGMLYDLPFDNLLLPPNGDY